MHFADTGEAGPAAEVLHNFFERVRAQRRAAKRRSKGIVDIRVSWKPKRLYFHSACASSKKPEIEGVWMLKGQIDLIQQTDKVYTRMIQLPDGVKCELRVITLGPDSVMISMPGSSWFVNGQVGKRKDGEEDCPSDNVSWDLYKPDEPSPQ
uniref:Uncharacterized protein n=1 Tax=Pseudomonas phage RVTF4 TaxID=3236931 RepID=A0AB39CDI9_9VIRU